MTTIIAKYDLKENTTDNFNSNYRQSNFPTGFTEIKTQVFVR